MASLNREVQPQAKLPSPDVYEEEYRYWPWGDVLAEAAKWVSLHARKGAHIVDYMCGTGYLLNSIGRQRPDVSLEGWDICAAFIRYGRARYSGVLLNEGDALLACPTVPPDIVICTAGIHHLVEDAQRFFVSKVASELASAGYFLIGEEVLSPMSSERQRLINVIELHAELLRYAADRTPPSTFFEAACDVLANDLLQRGEYKLSRDRLRDLVASSFRVLSEQFVWPNVEGKLFGDVLLVCEPENRVL